ncbi:nucleotidyltransferase family protein [Advenella kashmirensis]|uniref:nucleotidyltransferase family protein n=1 Tax=Advenella kashmirensis TaxID=310575 RepID=UPI000403A1B1|nr:nucleotidyltransferase family protein [Advenella kashmirensis]
MTERTSPTSVPDIVALVLAAGKGSRFDASGTRYKPVQALADRTPMVYAVCHTLLQHIAHVTVVCGPQEQAVHSALGDLPVRTVHCTEAHQGMSASLRCGVQSSPASVGWIIALSDMPFIRAETVSGVASRLRQGEQIIRPAYQGKPGHPVAFASKFRDQLLGITGDEGARTIIRRHPDALTVFTVNDPGCLIDIDTVEQLQRHGTGEQ